MMMAYSRLGKYEDARRSMKRILDFARRFRMDNPLVDFGGAVYQPHQPINCCYDTFGAPAALIRGLFEYLYRADGLTILPHVPPGIVELTQRFAIRFGSKRLFLSTVGRGPVAAVTVNGKPWKRFDPKSIFLAYDETPETAQIQIVLGDAKAARPGPTPAARVALPTVTNEFWRCEWLAKPLGPQPRPLRIGADSDGKSRFIGDIGRARIFRRALKPDEIAALARNDDAALGKDPALVADWTFEDLKAASLSTKIVGKVDVVDATGAGGPGGKAIRLTGEGYVEVAHNPKLILTDAYALSAWVLPKKLPSGGGRIIDKSTVGTSDNYLLDTHPGNSLRLITQQGHITHRANLPPDTWSHVAATFDARGELRLYVNGKQVASCPAKPVEGLGSIEHLRTSYDRLRRFHDKLTAAGLGDTYEAAHAGLAVEAVATLQTRQRLLAEGKIQRLPDASQRAADKCYVETAVRLCDGLAKVLETYAESKDPHRKRVHQCWRASKSTQG